MADNVHNNERFPFRCVISLAKTSTAGRQE